MSGPTTDDGGPWSFDSLMNSSDEEDESDDPGSASRKRKAELVWELGADKVARPRPRSPSPPLEDDASDAPDASDEENVAGGE